MRAATDGVNSRTLFAGSLAVLVSIYSTAAFAGPSISWVRLEPAQSPSPCAGSAMAYDPVSNQVVLFGGFNGSYYLDHTWTFDGTTWTPQKPNISPPPRAAAMMAFDEPTAKLVLFGGYDGSQYFGDTWLWNGVDLTWTEAHPNTQPPGVTGPMMFTDPKTGQAATFGGYNRTTRYQGDTWQWDGSDWNRLSPLTSPYARGAGVVALDSMRNNVVIFGGLSSVFPGNTWLWDGTNWAEQSTTTQPPILYYTAATFDPDLQTVIVFGGGSGGETQDRTWAWTGADWVELQPLQSPPARESLSMAYHSATKQLIIFGGTDTPDGSRVFNDTWSLVQQP